MEDRAMDDLSHPRDCSAGPHGPLCELGDVRRGAGHAFGRIRQVVRLLHRLDIRRGHRCRLLPVDGGAGLVPFWLSDGCNPGHPTEVLLAISHYDERWPVHLVWQLLDLLRNGHRCAMVCAEGTERDPGCMRLLRDVRDG